MYYRTLAEMKREFVTQCKAHPDRFRIEPRDRAEINDLASSASEGEMSRNTSCLWGRSWSNSRSGILSGFERQAWALPLSRAHVRRGGMCGRFGASCELVVARARQTVVANRRNGFRLLLTEIRARLRQRSWILDGAHYCLVHPYERTLTREPHERQGAARCMLDSQQ
jgi:hypothetical protein